MNNNQDPAQVKSPVVTFSNIPLDDEPAAVGYDAIPPEALAPTEITVVGVQFKKGGKIYYFDPGNQEIPAGCEVIIDTARGAEFGYCAESNHSVPAEKVVQPLRPVIRVATEQDKRTRQEFKERETEAFDRCQEMILEHQLDMKLVSAEYSFDGSKLLFYFTADGRVDFRELVKDLAGVFRTRIELRQIGVRDEAKMMGGLGICGRPFCCKEFLEDFQPVSIKMAKTQNLSLNPTKISGTCGRLMCCLKYEQDAYESLLKTSPKMDSAVNTCDGVGTITEVNLLKESVKVRLESDPSSIKTYQNCDICVLRSGKAKKTDPPIPTDLPPLPKKKEPEQEEFSMFDESSLKRLEAQLEARETAPAEPAPQRTSRSERRKRAEQKKQEESGATEQAQNAPQEKPQNQGGKKKSSHRSGHKPKGQKAPETARKEAPAQDAKAADPKPEGKSEGKSGGKSRNSRHRYYRSKKPSGGNKSGQS